ncbi:MAG TPA: hypothetical protein VM537_30295, partial [Anaerolineae bacterium]|nr:hypothetical protein [Anaerolineae bacterium]
GRAAAHGAEWQPQSRCRAALAGLPLLLIGVGVAIVSALLRILGGTSRVAHVLPPSLPHAFALAVGVALLAGLCATAGLALTCRLPAWAYPWVMLNLIGLGVTLNLVTEGLGTVYSPTADLVLLALLALATLAHLAAAAARGWQYKGLLSPAFGCSLGLSLCFWASVGPRGTTLDCWLRPLVCC